jgi:hypothetical protein
MTRLFRLSSGSLWRGIGLALLWGAAEFIALARSRWSARWHTPRQAAR